MGDAEEITDDVDTRDEETRNGGVAERHRSRAIGADSMQNPSESASGANGTTDTDNSNNSGTSGTSDADSEILFCQLPGLEDIDCQFDGLEKSLQILTTRRTLIVHCQHTLFLAEAACQILKSTSFSTFEATEKWLHSDPTGTQELGGFEKILTEAHRLSNQSPRKHAFLVVHVHRTSEAMRILTHLKQDMFGRITDRLRSSGAFIVFCFDPKLHVELKGEPSSAALPVWEVNFLLPMLHRHYESLPDPLKKNVLQPADLSARMKSQSVSWPPRDSRDFYESVIRLLNSGSFGYQELSEVVRQGKQTCLPEQIDGDDPVMLREPSQSLVFVASMAPELHLSVFEQLMESCLNRVCYATAMPDDHPFNTPLKEWSAGRTRLLEQNGLRVQINGSGESVIDFADYQRGKRMRERFCRMVESREKLNRLILPALFDYDRPLPSHAFDSLASQLGGFASQNPRDYTVEWLVGLFVESYRYVPAFGQHDDVHDVILSIITTVRGRRHFYGRLADLCMQLLGRPRTTEIVTQFLSILCRRLDVAVSGFVLQLSRRLRLCPGFDELHWLKLVLEQGPPDARRDARRQLRARVVELGSFWKGLEEVQQWMPAADAERCPQKTSQTALFFPFLVFPLVGEGMSRPASTISISPMEELKDFSQDDRSFRLGMLAKWFVHPLLPEACGEVVRDDPGLSQTENSADEGRRLGFLLEMSKQIEDSDDSSATSLRQFLEVVQSLGPRKFCRQLAIHANAHAAQMDIGDGNSSKEEIRLQKKKRERLRALRKLLREV